MELMNLLKNASSTFFSWAIHFLRVGPRGSFWYNGSEIHGNIADMKAPRVELFFEKNMSHDSYFLRSLTQATYIENICFKPFLGSSKLQRPPLKMAENLQLSSPRFEPQTLQSASQHASNSPFTSSSSEYTSAKKCMIQTTHLPTHSS
jgi:hypothetical protein